MQVYVEVEENDNTFGVPLRVFSAKGETYQAVQVKMDTKAGVTAPHWITGWSSDGDGAPCPAFCVAVEDSGAALSYLVYGGDWGIRFKPVGDDEAWDVRSERQFGEPYLLLADESDVTRAES